MKIWKSRPLPSHSEMITCRLTEESSSEINGARIMKSTTNAAQRFKGSARGKRQSLKLGISFVESVCDGLKISFSTTNHYRISGTKLIVLAYEKAKGLFQCEATF